MKSIVGLAAVVFAVVACAHAARLALGWDVTIGPWSIPRWISAAGAIGTALLAAALARAARRGRWERTGS